MFVRIPKGAYAGPHRELLVRKLNEAAFAAEQIPEHPAQRALCWRVIDEVEPGRWFCGGIDRSRQLLTCIAMAYLPARRRRPRGLPAPDAPGLRGGIARGGDPR